MASTTSQGPVAFPPTLVFGASGRVGRMLRSLWQIHPVVWTSRTAAPGITQLDLLKQSRLAEELAGQATVIVCLAGVVPGAGDLSENTELALAAIHAARNGAAKSVILFSSAAVYGDSAEVWREDMQTHPVSEYGAAKLDMEQAARRLAKEAGLSVSCLRIGNIAGADAILGNWKPGFQLDQMPDGQTPLRSYIGPNAFADCLWQLVRQADRLPEILNVAVPKPVRMGELLDEARLDWIPRPASQNVISNVVLNVDRLQGLVQFDKTAHRVCADWAAWKEKSARR